jgi:hypothetical protein
MRKILFLSISVLIIIACTKEPIDTQPDYRDKYIGKYRFEIEHVNWWMTNDSSGWGYSSDTLYTIGYIEKYKTEQLLIKYNNENISGLWVRSDSACDCTSICSIEDTTSLPEMSDYLIFWGYYENWTSPILENDSILKMYCIPFDCERGGIHETFGGYFINSDSVYFGYSAGGLGGGSFTEIYGRKINE